MRYLLLPILLAAVPTSAAAQTQTTLTATDSKSIASNSQQNWNDNRLRAYWSSASLGFVDGLAKFDLSSIPDTATITGLTYRVYHEASFGSPSGGPSVSCYRVADDSWARANGSDPHPGLGAALTLPTSTFNAGSLAANDFVLDVNAANWSVDLLDDTLSLALRNENGTLGIYSYVYFYGSDVSPAPPELIVDYISGPSVAVTAGAPGGVMTFEFTNFTPNALIAVVYGPGGQSTTIQSSTCAGTILDLNPLLFPTGARYVLLNSDAIGGTAVTRAVSSNLSGLSVQALDVSSCLVSNSLTL